jgi:AAA domain
VTKGPDAADLNAKHKLPPDPFAGATPMNGAKRGAVEKNGSSSDKSDRTPRAVLTRLDTVQRRPVRYLWRGRVPFGKITILDGDPGNGKSTIALDLAARLTAGRPMPGEDNATSAPADVLIVSAEDDAADTLRPRLEAAEADLSRVHLLTVQCGQHELLPMLTDHLPQIEEALLRTGAKLLVLDPLVAVLGDHVDMHKDQDMRRVLGPVKVVAERIGVAVVGIRHFNKNANASALHRGGGSIGISGGARSVLAVARDPRTPERRVLAAVKSNVAEVLQVPSLAFRIEVLTLPVVGAAPEVETTRIDWLGPSPLTADDLLAASVPQTHEERSALDEAKAVVRQVLGKGAVPAKDLAKEARAAGVSERTLQRARAELGVKASKPLKEWILTLPAAGASSAVGGLGALDESKG